MDPLAQALAMLQEAQQVMAMQAEEIQALRQQVQKPEGKAKEQGQPMQKQAAEVNLAAIIGLKVNELPEFIKNADEASVRDFMSVVESRTRQTMIGKVAEINDGLQSDDPAEVLEASLSGLLG